MSREMREKYGRGIVSESYIDTGMPKHYTAALKQFEEDQAALAAFDRKAEQKAEKKAAAAFRKKSKKGKEYRIVFA